MGFANVGSVPLPLSDDGSKTPVGTGWRDGLGADDNGGGVQRGTVVSDQYR